MNEENRDAAENAGLRYVTDQDPGISRRRARKGFDYYDAHGKKISSPKIIQRLESLVIPPAWEKVWICNSAHGHLQCTGYDVKRRKQYMYHPSWSKVRNETKFAKLARFGQLLPAIRRQVKKDLSSRDFKKEKVLAAVVQLMQDTRIRIGNDFYASNNNSYGLTTMLNRHVKVTGTKIHFHFKGKSGIQHELDVSDPRLSRIIKHCQELPGQELFAYEDENGRAHDIGSEDVNEYLKSITGEQITAKDFRTWSGTLKALEILLESKATLHEAKQFFKTREVSTIKDVALHLGNTVAICRKYYVHPLIFEADLNGGLRKAARTLKKAHPGLSREESVLLKLLPKL